MKSVKTPKGTDLPLLDLRGKAYLQVAYRLVWFKEEHPDWSIETDFLQTSADSSFAKATIRNEAARVMATAHKFEDKQGFADHREKAETGAVGRALAMVGYGTQFTDDLDEADRLADSPLSRPQSAPKPLQGGSMVPAPNKTSRAPSAREIAGDYMIQLGQNLKGKKLRSADRAEVFKMLEWLEKNSKETRSPLSDAAITLRHNYDVFYASQPGSDDAPF